MKKGFYQELFEKLLIESKKGKWDLIYLKISMIFHSILN